MSFHVLSDASIKSILGSLTRANVHSIQSTLHTAFKAYSLNNESQYQPHRASITRPDGQTTLFMPATSPTSVGAKIIGVPPPTATGKTLAGVLVLCDTEGKPTGILNAEEVTAFRTALGSMALFGARKKVERIVVFGAGKQAFWHVRLALLLRGEGIKSVKFVNRSRGRSEEVVGRLKGVAEEFGVEVVGFDGDNEGEEGLKRLVKGADVLFFTTPARSPVFPAKWLEEAVREGRGPYLAAIGSYKIEMKEVDPVLFQNVVGAEKGYHPKGGKGGAVVVDSREGCFQESGEIVQGEIKAESIVEVGELLDIKERSKDSGELGKWLEEGLVIYKSVGIGIMDLAVGNALVELAKEKDVGVGLPAL